MRPYTPLPLRGRGPKKRVCSSRIEPIDPHRDTLGLRAFLEKTANNAPFGVLITLQDGADIPDPRIVALPLSTLLLMR